MDKNLQKELLDLLTKHGLKADDIKSESKEVVEKEKSASEVDKGVVADLASSIAKKLADAIAENKGLDKKEEKNLEKDIKSKIFTNWGGMKEVSYPSDLGNLSKEEKIVNFFKALIYAKADPQSMTVLRALTEGTDADGGYLVPEELRSEVFRMLPDMAVMRNIARVIPMASDTLKLNSLTARPTAYWTGEYQSKSTTSAEFGQVTLTPNDLVCLLPISEQLLADANIDLVQFIIQLFTEAIAVAEDKAFFTGSGTGQPKGINQESLRTVAAGGAFTFDHVIAVMDQVPQRATQSPKAAFVAHRRVKSICRSLRDLNGNYIWRDGGMANNGETKRLPDTLYGYPFHEENDLSQSELYFGDWAFYIIGDRQTVSVKTTTEGGDAWRRNGMEIKAVERVDGRAVMASPFAKVTGI